MLRKALLLGLIGLTAPAAAQAERLRGQVEIAYQAAGQAAPEARQIRQQVKDRCLQEMEAASDWAQTNDQIFPTSGPVIPILKSYELAQANSGKATLIEARERLGRQLEARGARKAARELRAIWLQRQKLTVDAEQLCQAVKDWAADQYQPEKKPDILAGYKKLNRTIKSSKELRALAGRLRKQGLSKRAAGSLRRGLPAPHSTRKEDAVRRALIPEWLEAGPLV